MRRVLGIGIGLLAAIVILLPLGFRFVPQEVAELPPVDRRIAVSGNASVAAFVRGRGPTVVLVHGLPGQATDWTPLIKPLVARGHRVIAYSRLGYSRSDERLNGDFTPDGNARDLLALLAGEGVREATVVGWSYGGATAIRAALRDPSRIGRLVLVGSAGPWPDAPSDPVIFSLLFSRPVLAWARAVPPVSASFRESLSRHAFASEPIPKWWLPALAANFANPETARTWREEGRRFAWGDDLDPAPIARPILVIHGDEDRNVPLSVGRTLAERATEGRLVVIEGGSHMLPITRPERLADLIADFAAGRPARP